MERGEKSKQNEKRKKTRKGIWLEFVDRPPQKLVEGRENVLGHAFFFASSAT